MNKQINAGKFPELLHTLSVNNHRHTTLILVITNKDSLVGRSQLNLMMQ